MVCCFHHLFTEARVTCKPEGGILSMRRIYGKFIKYAMVRAALLLVMGVLTLRFPQFLLRAIVYVLAGYAILNGVLSVVDYFGNRDDSPLYLDFVTGFLSIALGVVTAVFFHHFVSILPVFLGVLMMLEGIVYFVNAMSAG